MTDAIIDIGSPEPSETTAGVAPAALRPAVFLDRDGVINVDFGYVHRPDDLVFTPTAIEGIRLLNDAGHLVVVITNQSGVARGYFGVADVDRFHEAIQDRLREEGAHVDAFYYCPYHPAGRVMEFAREHDDRKPNPGMILRALRDLPIDRQASVMIGDQARDLECAARADMRGLLVDADTCDLAAVARRVVRHGIAGFAAE